jgi:hypothetical protein
MAKKDKPNTVVINTRKGCVMMPELGMLKPGANVKPTKLVKAAQAKLKGNSEEGERDGWPSCVVADVEAPVGTHGRDELSARKLVEETFDVETLKSYRKDEKRRTILDAIATQIKALTDEPKDDDADDEPEEPETVEKTTPSKK